MKYVTIFTCVLWMFATSSTFGQAPSPQKSSPKVEIKKATPKAVPPATPAVLEKGKTIFTTQCVACHGEKGDGNTVAGQALTPKPRNFLTEDFKFGDEPAKVFDTITKGSPGTAMVGYSFLSEEERWALTHYVLSLKKKK